MTDPRILQAHARYRKTAKGRAACQRAKDRYEQSEQGKASRTAYDKSEKRAASSKRYRTSAKGRASRNAVWRNCYANNPGIRSRAVARGRERAAKFLSAVIGDRSAIAKIYARAAVLKRWFDVAVDHIFPLSKGGSHSADNLQIIYSKENSAKGNKIGYTPSVVFA